MGDQSEDRKRTFILISVSIGMLMTAMDTTIVLLALPTMTVELKAPFMDTIWVILVYLLVLATLTTQVGKLGDIFGRGRIFNAGFLIFIVGSAMAGASPNVDFIVISRIIQGLGAVLLQANMSALISDYFNAEERGRAFGITIMWY
jgi:MFS family permease